MLLDLLGEAAAAWRLMSAIETVMGRDEVLTLDLGGSGTTETVTKAVRAALVGANGRASLEERSTRLRLPDKQPTQERPPSSPH